MSEQRRSPASAAAFRRFILMIALLRNRGFSDERIDSFIREKIAADLANHKARRLLPSLN